MSASLSTAFANCLKISLFQASVDLNFFVLLYETNPAYRFYCSMGPHSCFHVNFSSFDFDGSTPEENSFEADDDFD